jgi:hypothetical protein
MVRLAAIRLSQPEGSMTKKQIKEAVDKLDAISVYPPDEAHATADKLLLEVVPVEVKKAYERVMKRCGWWAYA